MTPEEKAIDLMDKFTYACRECDGLTNSKQSAFVVIDEMLKLGWNLPHYKQQKGIQYWKQVKQEIEKL